MVRTLDLAKQAAIMAAAKAIFTREGYAAAKMTDIAIEAGVAPGTLYLYFENKEALASTIGEEFFAELIAQFGQLIRAIEDPDGVVTLVDWGFQVADRERVLLAMVRERKQDPKSKQVGRQPFISHLAESLAELMSRGVIRHYADATALADVLLALMRRVIMSSAVFQDEQIEQLKDGSVTVLQHALFDDVTLAANRLVKRKQKRE
jgi:AcrR family transcriptional regulator